MKFGKKLIPGRLLKRYKRFMADIELESGDVVTAHCPNSGSMRGVKEAGSRVYLTPYEGSSGRKLLYTWEMIECEKGWVGINTSRTNALVEEALSLKMIQAFKNYSNVRREVKYAENSRIDFLLEGEGLPPLYLEVKNVTLREDGIARFPDAVTERGTKHLKALMRMVEEGARSAILYVVQREDCEAFALAKKIDPKYADMAILSKNKGVETYCYACHVSPYEISLRAKLQIID